MVFHNGLNYGYHFIIKELAKEFEGEFNCLGENAQKYFSVPITNKVLDKKRFIKMKKKKKGKTIPFNLQILKVIKSY